MQADLWTLTYGYSLCNIWLQVNLWALTYGNSLCIIWLQVDLMGPCLMVCETEGGAVCGGYAPKGCAGCLHTDLACHTRPPGCSAREGDSAARIRERCVVAIPYSARTQPTLLTY